ncbi:MAG: glycosyltransferase [Chloroflexi bacterium]|nr:MAG: glycosyltransferase [Chloroflexota bacterium]
MEELRIQEVELGAQPIDRFLSISGAEAIARAKQLGEEMSSRLTGRAVWSVNSTATGGGVAEMLRSVLPYVRGFGIDCRWVVIGGTPDFFRITKRLHHALHGSYGDGSPLGDDERAVYESVLRANVGEISGLVRPRDVVVLHDPQTAGLAPTLRSLGAIVIWRCHIGADDPNPETEVGWRFLEPYICDATATVFTRRQYVPDICNHGRSVIIPPSIDPFSPKNQEMADDVARAILVHTGLLGGTPPEALPTFVRLDGSPGRVDRRADVIGLGPVPSPDAPLVVQVSRWDPLKDPVGVMWGFARLAEMQPQLEANLILAGPNVHAIEDDPESARTLDAVIERWRALAHRIRERVHLASLPTADLEENGAIVNALQRQATVVVQKSLREGFGLTVTEAMWKERAVLASAVGGIQDQITDNENGLLLEDPNDLESFASLLGRLLSDAALRQRLGEQARERVRTEYVPLRHLTQYADLLERIDAA